LSSEAVGADAPSSLSEAADAADGRPLVASSAAADRLRLQAHRTRLQESPDEAPLPTDAIAEEEPPAEAPAPDAVAEEEPPIKKVLEDLNSLADSDMRPAALDFLEKMADGGEPRDSALPGGEGE